jgi:hypothetical protein
MADPGAEAIMIEGIQFANASAHFLDAVNELAALSGMGILARKRREEPACTFEQIGMGELHSGVLLARHGMTSEKALGRRSAESFGGMSDDLGFGAPHVGDKGARRKRGTEAVDQVEDADDGSGKDDEIAAVNCICKMCRASLDCSAINGAFENGRAIAPDDAAGEMALLEREAKGASDQAGADNGDLFERHW